MELVDNSVDGSPMAFPRHNHLALPLTLQQWVIFSLLSISNEKKTHHDVEPTPFPSFYLLGLNFSLELHKACLISFTKQYVLMLFAICKCCQFQSTLGSGFPRGYRWNSAHRGDGGVKAVRKLIIAASWHSLCVQPCLILPRSSSHLLTMTALQVQRY